MRRNILCIVMLILGWAVSCVLAAGQELKVDAEVTAVHADSDARKQLETRSIEILKSEAPAQEKERACRVLRVVGTSESIPALAELLPDPALSHAARYALEPMPCPEAAAALRDALPKVHGTIKIGIIHSLAERADKEASSLLISLLKDGDTRVAAAAAWALGQAGTPQAAEALAKFRAEAPRQLQAAAMEASLIAAQQLLDQGSSAQAAEIYEELYAAKGPRHVRLGAFLGLLAAEPQRALSRIEKAIAGKNPILRSAAIASIADTDQETVVAGLAKRLSSYPAETQVLLIDALAHHNTPTVHKAITKATSNSSPNVRKTAIKALGDIGNVTSVELLVRTLAEGKTTEEKQATGTSLRRLSADGVDDAIIRLMKRAQPPARAELIGILRDRHALSAVDSLLAEATSRHEAVRRAAFKALASLAEPKDLPRLIELLVQLKDDAARSEAEQAVTAISRRIEDEAERANVPLSAFSNAQTAAAKCSLIRVLQAIANAKALSAVENALKDDSPKVQDAAARALADWPNPQATEILVGIFQTTDNRTHRVLALRGCTRLLALGGHTAQDRLDLCKELMSRTQTADEKRLVLACLAKVADPAALEIVEPQFRDGEVKAEAELAALSIAHSIVDSAPEKAQATAKKLLDESASDSIRKEATKLLQKINNTKVKK